MESKEDLTSSLYKVMGFFNRQGRLVEAKPDGTFIMAGLKFNSIEEIDEAIRISMIDFSKDIR